MFARQKPEVGMNLPVASHIDRLAEIVDSMKSDTESMQKQLQILRGNITQLSYINKESDKQLNSFLIDGIASLRNKWDTEVNTTHWQLQEHKKKLLKLNQQHEDVQIMRQQLQYGVLQLNFNIEMINFHQDYPYMTSSNLEYYIVYYIQQNYLIKKEMHSLDKYNPSVFDTFITDISAETIKSDISVQLKQNYLAPLQQHEKQIQEMRTGIIYGGSYRGFISIPTRFKDRKPIWIHYLIDTGSPKTFITLQAMTALIGPNIEAISTLPVLINGQTILVGMSSHHFDCVNILGMDFLMGRRQLRYLFPGMGKISVTIEF